jgi:hypothetical protein
MNDGTDFSVDEHLAKVMILAEAKLAEPMREIMEHVGSISQHRAGPTLLGITGVYGAVTVKLLAMLISIIRSTTTMDESMRDSYVRGLFEAALSDAKLHSDRALTDAVTALSGKVDPRLMANIMASLKPPSGNNQH